MKRITTLSYAFTIAMSLSASPVVLADAAVDFAELASKRQTKTVQSAPQLIELTGATTSVKGCLGYDGAQLREKSAPYHDTIMLYANRYGIDHNLIKSVIAVESCYNVSALSPKSAQGLMQLIPATAERFGINDPSDSAQNIRGGARYLAWLIARFKGDVSKALAGYNAGEGAVDKYDGIPPYRETQNYVVNVLGLYQRLSNKATPTVMASATQALQQDLEGISAELTAVLRGDAAIATANTNTGFSDEIEQAAARAAALASRPTLDSPLLQRNVVQANANKQRPNANIIPASAHKTLNPTRVDAANELAARVISGLIQGGPPIHHAQAAASAPRTAQAVKRPVTNVTNMANQSQAKPPINVARANTTPKRVTHTYFTALSKPGRGGWEANRARAPSLYKQ